MGITGTPALNEPTHDSKFLVEGFCSSVDEKAQRAVEDFKCLSPRLYLPDPHHATVPGFTLCYIVGMYLAKNCDMPNLAKQSESQDTRLVTDAHECYNLDPPVMIP